MKITAILGLLSTALVISSFTCTTRKDAQTPAELAVPRSYYTIQGALLDGFAANNTTLRAVEVPCNNNNTLRLYYSKSANFSGSDTALRIVASSNGNTLKSNECYLEVTTSATDTWLTTGTGTGTVRVRKASDQSGTGNSLREYYTFELTQAPVQHFTSVPLNDFSTVKDVILSVARF